jgi:alkyl sulfatase BDS1-like metallo-beta-lactamase superfamily hydrolase
MSSIRTLADAFWSGAIDPHDKSPFAPLLQSEEVAQGVLFISSFANVCAVATERGLVLVDTGSAQLADYVHSRVRKFSDAPVHTAVFTHGHVDHVMGIDIFDGEARRDGRALPRVIAHQAVPARFDRYRQTRGYNACINRRQFQMPVEWPAAFREPDETFQSQLHLAVGDVDIELHHARGETDDHAWVFVPSRALLCTGDLFIWAVPNAGNPQKVQRYPREWAQALRRMAALGAEVMLPGHGLPIFGKARVEQALTETAQYLESLHDQVLALMNEGAPLDEILNSVTPPAALADRPFLQPLYDEPQFIVRNLWRLYGGWWDGNAAELKPAPRAKLAAEVASLVGGADPLMARAESLAADAADDSLALACHLAELAARAAPDDEALWQRRAAIYRRRAAIETSLMARGIFTGAAEELPPKPARR